MQFMLPDNSILCTLYVNVYIPCIPDDTDNTDTSDRSMYLCYSASQSNIFVIILLTSARCSGIDYNY